MLLFTHLIGLGFLMVGVLGISSYYEDLESFRLKFFYRELKPMQARWGRTAGTILHFVEYVLIPAGLGVIFLSGTVFHP